MPTKPVAYQHLRAKNDVNGNPRRLFVVYGPGGEVLEVIDEGYRGWPVHLRDIAQLPTFDITPTEYRQWLRRTDTVPS
jgi:hypothetical protein